MQVVANNKTPAAGEIKSRSVPVRLQPADAMQVIKRLEAVSGAIVDLTLQEMSDAEVERFEMERLPKGFHRTDIRVFQIRGSDEESNLRLALRVDGTWEIWTNIDV